MFSKPGHRPWSQSSWYSILGRSAVRQPQPVPSSLCLPRYFLMERGKNMCGLAACASYPIPLV